MKILKSKGQTSYADYPSLKRQNWYLSVPWIQGPRICFTTSHEGIRNTRFSSSSCSRVGKMATISHFQGLLPHSTGPLKSSPKQRGRLLSPRPQPQGFCLSCLLLRAACRSRLAVIRWAALVWVETVTHSTILDSVCGWDPVADARPTV